MISSQHMCLNITRAGAPSKWSFTCVAAANNYCYPLPANRHRALGCPGIIHSSPSPLIVFPQLWLNSSTRKWIIHSFPPFALEYYWQHPFFTNLFIRSHSEKLSEVYRTGVVQFITAYFFCVPFVFNKFIMNNTLI